MGMLVGLISQQTTPIAYSLSGTTGSPNLSNCTKDSGTLAFANWQFQSNLGRVLRRVDCSNALFGENVEWIALADRPPAADLWIRAENNDGSDPNSISDDIDSWLPLVGTGGQNREWRWERGGFDPGTYAGSIWVRISTDSGGSSIVAEGYYGGTATVNP